MPLSANSNCQRIFLFFTENNNHVIPRQKTKKIPENIKNENKWEG